MSFFETFRREDQGPLGPPPPPFRFGARRRPPVPGLGRWLVAAVILIVLFVVLNIAKSIYADWLWFQAEGYGSVYSKTILTNVQPFFARAGVSPAFVLGNLLLALRLGNGRRQAHASSPSTRRRCGASSWQRPSPGPSSSPSSSGPWPGASGTRCCAT